MAVPYEISHEWEEPDGLHDLLQAIREQRDDADVRRIRYAYYLAEKAHAGQTRQSGEAYILHPLAVAAILVDLHMDDDTIVAALLHDVIEDSPHTVEDLAETFGEDVANYREVEELVKHSRKDREKELSQAILALKDRLEKRGVIGAEVQGRPKHLFSIFNKMAKQGLEFHEIYDLLGLRLIVPSRSDCYIALGIVHDLWVPIPGLFFDYIATPKPNGYQSLHTKVVGPGGTPIEVQIRTREMHEVAEYGIAAHWSYKEGKLALDESTRLQQLREQLFDWSSDARTSSDFLRSISTDLFAEQVFVFTPKGDVLDLPTNSTPVDFAFRVHTQLGMTLVGAKVNGALVPLGTALKNGDVVEIITRSNAQPSLDWLEFVRSAHARAKLRAHFRKLSRTEDAAHGKETLDKELKALGLDPRQFLGEDRLDQLAEQFDGCDNGSDLLAKVGAGLISVQTVLQKMRGIAGQVQEADQIHLSRTKEGKVQLVTSGLESVMVHRAKCCSPI
ncbi:MAG: bifunctional (p)ppGpp synthetase/guanosine-3',5'-bis(diphosphate) 3'-pyrophosphohydrolase, partial [Fimbriimonas ginsengisoli]|nr:bifunctional (p)ppGpp synthetase/guanosine-3',5'-bis(diphosphate) 3'-pyrophosphohydrolase [Fimbriimonas ginsengisoli]